MTPTLRIGRIAYNDPLHFLCSDNSAGESDCAGCCSHDRRRDNGETTLFVHARKIGNTVSTCF